VCGVLVRLKRPHISSDEAHRIAFGFFTA